MDEYVYARRRDNWTAGNWRAYARQVMSDEDRQIIECLARSEIYDPIPCEPGETPAQAVRRILNVMVRNGIMMEPEGNRDWLSVYYEARRKARAWCKKEGIDL